MNWLPAAVLAAFMMVLAALPVRAEPDLVIGGDVYAGGPAASSPSSERDAFVYGASVHLDGDVAGDAHATGFDVDIDGDVGADLYATGGSIALRGAVGEDLSAAGFRVRLDDDASVGNNARLVGRHIGIDAPIGGSLLAAGGTIKLNAPVKGDARLRAGEIEFGPKARIAGTLTISAKDTIEVPAAVIPAERVRKVPLADTEIISDLRHAIDEEVRSFWPSFFGFLVMFVVTLAFFLAVAAVCLTYLPATVERLQARALDRPGPAALAGFLALALIAGLVPVSVLTIIALPLIPLIMLAILLLWLLGYLLGAYAVSMRVWKAFANEPGPHEPLARRLTPLAVGLVVLAVLNFIPFAGWLINLAVVFVGLGAIALWAVDKGSAGRLDTGAPATQ